MASPKPSRPENSQQDQEYNRNSQAREHGREGDTSRDSNSASATDGGEGAETQVTSKQRSGNVARNQAQHENTSEPYLQQNGQQVAAQNQQVQDKGKGAPSVRLDMNLDVEIELKAKVKGDLELSVL